MALSIYRALMALLRVRNEIRRNTANNTTIPDLFARSLAKHKSKAAILYEDQTWSFQDLENYSNSVANYFMSEGFHCGDVVAVVLENSTQIYVVTHWSTVSLCQRQDVWCMGDSSLK